MANPMLPPRPLPGDTTCCLQDWRRRPFPCPQTTAALAGGRRRRHAHTHARTNVHADEKNVRVRLWCVWMLLLCPAGHIFGTGKRRC